MRALLFCVLMTSVPAMAQFSGTISGNITITDSRTTPYAYANDSTSQTVSGARWDHKTRFAVVTSPSPPLLVTTPSIIPLSRAYVLVQVCNIFASCSYFATYTSANGNFSRIWAAALPSSVTVYVYAERQKAVPSDPVGSYAYTVTSYQGFSTLLASAGAPMPFSGNVAINFTVPASEQGNTYITADETIRSLQFDPGVGAAMPALMNKYIHDLDIQIDTAGIPWPGAGGVSPSDETVIIAPGFGTGNPFTVAHEMGHVMHWRAHEHATAPINPVAHYNCDGVTGWTQLSLECERAAFADGWANFIAEVWMWSPKTYAGVLYADTPRSGGGFSRLPLWQAIGSPNGCPLDNMNHRRPFCNSRALYSLYSASYTNFDAYTILSSLDAYPSGSCNHCNDEGSWLANFNANNWFDYRWNFLGGGNGISSINTIFGMDGSSQL
jgi:hypothetical protein